MTISIDTQIAIKNLKEQVNNAENNFAAYSAYHDDWLEPSWLIESCFIQLLAIVESLGLVEMRNMIHKEYIESKEQKEGLAATIQDPEGESYSLVLSRIRCFLLALEKMFPSDDKTTVTKDLLQLIRDIHYFIADTTIFQSPPSNEADVHNRIEAILKCVFPDLKHKPSITKQIKNFEPDSGISSIKTLIEYKFLSKKDDVGIIADQLLADTRGYTSKDWSQFIYVIYETERFRRERDWNMFLHESGVPTNTTVVVLSGIPSLKKSIKKSSQNVRPRIIK